MLFSGSAKRRKAVAYYRHSAEDKQENSVPLQRDFVHELLKKHDIEIIHEEADEGVSGLTANRPGFSRLFQNWILNPSAPQFDYVVVYDVSRWGRFEDADEAGYYEFQCKQAGKEVVYARRGFSTEEQRGQRIQQIQRRLAYNHLCRARRADNLLECTKRLPAGLHCCWLLSSHGL